MPQTNNDLISRPLRFLLAGIGSHGRMVWCDQVIPAIHASGRGHLVGVIDVSSEALNYARRKLGLDESQCFLSVAEATERSRADFLIDATLFAHREQVTGAALDAGLHVFMEKPVCGDLDACCRLLHKATSLGRKTAINFTNRFFCDKQSFDHYLHEGRCGPCDYIATRFGWRVDQRPRMPSHGQLLEGSTHALSYLRSMARSRAKFVTTHAWNPEWSVVPDGGSTNVFIEMENGVRCQMESSWAVRATLSPWGGEYVRAECREGTLELHRRKLVFWQEQRHHHPDATDLPLLERERWGHELLIHQFIDWVSGEREDHSTDFADSIQCMALTFAAIESARRNGERIDVQQFLADSMQRAANAKVANTKIA